MRIAYWIVAGPLALLYLYGGALKVLRSPDRLRPMMAWVDRVPLPALRTLGGLELLGAVGLLVPTALLAWPAPAAATGLLLLQVGAVPVHLTGGDRRIGLNLVLLAAAAAALWLSVA
ncbi:DoxX family protein [Kitasatospora sp. NA04385]|uniref:DoxX family protein n=1 Tax=Kitasatospora sp. NA04385 TaxID=2742135 RepID=UPI00158FB78D|nr:DoxX family protein [Kitasatospora sp. NA04385]QKW23429.1 DoxX family protein [Kitasatospora sp. NA04385]